MRIKEETKLKIKSIAYEVVARKGSDCLNLENIRSIFWIVGRNIGQPLSRYTIDKWWVTYISKVIMNVVKEVEATKVEVSEVDDIQAIVLIRRSGKKEVIWGSIPNKKELNKKELNKEEAQPPTLWLGLFDYKTTGEIIIKKDRRYVGCDVTKVDDIKRHFGNLFKFYEWCKWAHNEPNKPKFRKNAHTDKDVETLSKIMRGLERKFNLSELYGKSN
jgi:hypothetical protein